ncbi:MAG: ferric reductase [Acidimicrobiaceae bacterium]|nr:ferric reductase [Acidimicrobiaceae bacterium]
MSSTALWYATRATGIASLVLLSVTVVLGLTTAGRRTSTLWPGFARAELHKRVSLMTLVFLAIHVVTSVVDTYVSVGWVSILLPFSSSYHRWWLGLGTVGVDLGAAVMVSSLLRQRIPARLWRALHWLAYVSWPVAVAHSIGIGTDASLPFIDALFALCIAGVVTAALWRLSRALGQRRRVLDATAPRVGPVLGEGPSAAPPGTRTTVEGRPLAAATRVSHRNGRDEP